MIMMRTPCPATANGGTVQCVLAKGHGGRHSGERFGVPMQWRMATERSTAMERRADTWGGGKGSVHVEPEMVRASSIPPGGHEAVTNVD